MKYFNQFRVAPGSKVKLKDIDPGFKDHHEGHKYANLGRSLMAIDVLENVSNVGAGR